MGIMGLRVVSAVSLQRICMNDLAAPLSVVSAFQWWWLLSLLLIVVLLEDVWDKKHLHLYEGWARVPSQTPPPAVPGAPSQGTPQKPLAGLSDSVRPSRS